MPFAIKQIFPNEAKNTTVSYVVRFVGFLTVFNLRYSYKGLVSRGKEGCCGIDWLVVKGGWWITDSIVLVNDWAKLWAI